MIGHRNPEVPKLAALQASPSYLGPRQAFSPTTNHNLSKYNPKQWRLRIQGRQLLMGLHIPCYHTRPCFSRKTVGENIPPNVRFALPRSVWEVEEVGFLLLRAFALTFLLFSQLDLSISISRSASLVCIYSLLFQLRRYAFAQAARSISLCSLIQVDIPSSGR